MLLSEIQRDALAELFGIGAGSAAAQLSALLDDSIAIINLETSLIRSWAPELLQTARGRDCIAVCQDFSRDLSGRVLLLFHEEESLRLAHTLTATGPPFAELDIRPYEYEAIAEVGNILICSCVAAITDAIHCDVALSAPRCVHNQVAELFGPAADDETWVLARTIMLRATRRKLEGTFLFALQTNQMQDLLARVGRWRSSLCSGQPAR